MKRSLQKVFALLAIGLFIFTSCEETTTKGPKHEYVDLGLSVKWATCNVGAENPEEYGDYFAWGETQAKENYTWETYVYGLELTKYNKKDSVKIIELVDDIASINWGDAWRMPTKEEQEELLNECFWVWRKQNGVYGYTVTGKNGNFIFLPAAGYKNKAELYKEASFGLYWSSSLYETSAGSANIMHFDSKSKGQTINNRYIGATIRPVCP